MLKPLIQSIRMFMADKRGEFSIKGLAITVGAIVVVGAVVMWLSDGQMTTWIDELWTTLGGWMTETFKLGW